MTTKIVDLFSGAGGLSLGFEQPDRLNGLANLNYTKMQRLDFQTILAVEKNPHAAEAFRDNFDAEVIQKDIQEIPTFEQWADADVVIGGPPCQGFSTLNSKKTAKLNDTRNLLWKEFMRAVREINPDVFLMENVPRFCDSRQFKDVIKCAETQGYNVVAAVLNAEDFGVPQTRKRAIIIGSRLGTPVFPKGNEATRVVRDAIGDLPINPTGKNWHRKRKGTAKITEERMKHIPPGGNRHDIPKKLLPECWKNYTSGGSDLYGRLWWDKPAVTIRTTFYKPMTGRHLHPEANRSLTIREGARLQTFPDDFQFGGGPYWTRAATQIGNAVPPRLAYYLAKAIKTHIDGQDGEIAETTSHEVKIPMPIPV